jgi:LysM repeat protein
MEIEPHFMKKERINMAKGIDCATTITASVASALKAQGYDYVARYLGTNWKCMKQPEAQVIINAGLKVISLYETNPTYVGYFTNDKGKSDALAAVSFAQALGQPAGSTIYFAVDYNATSSDFSAIADYFNGVKSAIGSDYAVGVYGEYDVVKYLHDNNVVNYFMQTYAWSAGQKADFANIYQWKNGTTEAGIQVDLDVINSDPGAWPVAAAPSVDPTPAPTPAPPKPAPVVVPDTYTVKAGDTLSEIAAHFGLDMSFIENLNHISNPNLIRTGDVLKLKATAPTPQPSNVTSYTIKAGDTLSGIAAHFNTTVAVLKQLNHIADEDRITAGAVIKIPVAGHVTPQPSAPSSYKVVAGDTLSEIAVKFHTTIANLKKLNRITDEDKIFPGQVIKLK